MHVENISCLLFVLEPSKVSQNRNLTKRNRKKECNESGRFKIVCESMFEWMQMHLPAHLYWNQLYAVNLCPDVDCPSSPFHSIPKWLQSSCAHVEKKTNIYHNFRFRLGGRVPNFGTSPSMWSLHAARSAIQSWSHHHFANWHHNLLGVEKFDYGITL